jgi:predicted molibdopterin-dependent oxidoreductase YjgC
MGRLEDAELKLFLNGPSAVPRITPSLGMGAGFTSVEAPAEAARCLHCDCRAEGNCALERYGRMYGADPGRFREQRRRFEQHLQHGEIIYEPGKCILCGICVALTEQAREPLGLTFVGRGFDVRVAAPLNKTIAEGLQKVARDCVELCPTGALAFKDQVAGLPLTHACSRRRDEAEPGRS